MRKGLLPNSECWEWPLSKNRYGYGQINKHTLRKNGSGLAHRRIYLFLRGEIEEGKVTDHICRNPSCVNPWHLDIVTSKENTLRGNGRAAINARKEYCVRGHQYNNENTWLRKTKNGRVERVCKKCRTIKSK